MSWALSLEAQPRVGEARTRKRPLSTRPTAQLSGPSSAWGASSAPPLAGAHGACWVFVLRAPAEAAAELMELSSCAVDPPTKVLASRRHSRAACVSAAHMRAPRRAASYDVAASGHRQRPFVTSFAAIDHSSSSSSGWVARNWALVTAWPRTRALVTSAWRMRNSRTGPSKSASSP